jgi:hypothetical protein
MAATKTIRNVVAPVARKARSYKPFVGHCVAAHGRDQATYQTQTAFQNG